MTSTLFGGCARVRSNQPKVLHPQFCIRSFKLPRCPTFALLTRKVDAIDSIFSASRLMHMNTVPSVMFILHPGPTRVNGTCAHIDMHVSLAAHPKHLLVT